MKEPDFAAIEAQLRRQAGDSLARVSFETLNYGHTFGMAVFGPDGRKTAYLGGLVNRPHPDEDEDPNWTPVVLDLADAIPHAVAFLRA